MDPLARRKLLFSLSQPTNPVVGARLPFLHDQASAKAILSWAQLGWIEQIERQYYLTKKGSDALTNEQSVPPPESYFPFSYS